MIEEKAVVPIGAKVPVLFGEIKEIYGQYKREVPRKRGPWPQAIRGRVLELWRLGITTHQIARGTGLPIQTMYSWRKRLKKENAGGFAPITIGRSQVQPSHRHRSHGESRPLGTPRSQSHGGTTTVRIFIGNTIRVDGVRAGDVARIVREIWRA